MKKSFLALGLGLLAGFLGTQPCFAIGENNPTGVTGDWNGSVTTAGSYDPYTGNAKRVVDDLVVAGSLGAYPLKWSRVWNSRGGDGGFGSNWWHPYFWGMWTKVPVGGYIDGEYDGPHGQITYPDGRRVELQDWNTNWWVLMGGAEPMDRLVYMGNYNYDLVMHDGGRVRFIASGPPDSNGVTSFRVTAIIDPYGQATTIEYDSLGRFAKITEPGGRYLQINYNRLYAITCPSGLSCYADVISSVQAFASPGNLIETVTYHYTQELASGQFYSTFDYLTSVDYDDGSHAYYTYNPAGPSQLNNAWSVVAGSMKSCDDVRYAGPMKRIKFDYMEVSAAHPEITWGQLKAEKNWNGQTISEMEYPVYDPNQQGDPGWRKEHRGDGVIRTFQYSGAELSSYTDFLNQSSSIAYGTAPAPFQSVNYIQTFTDARSNVTTSEKEQEAGQVIRRTNSDGSMQTFAYEYVDGAPYYLQIHGDELGHNIYYARDASHRVIKIWYGYDSGNPNAFPTEEFTYNNFGQVLTHKLTSGGTESFEYDNHAPPATRGLKTKQTDPLGNVTTYEYYQSGANADRVYRVIDPRGNSTWHEYNQRGQVTKVTHQDGNYVQSAYNGDGTMAWSTDELGHTTSYTYDEYKRALTVSNALNETATNYYGLDGMNPLLQTTNTPKYTLSPMGKKVVYEYDANRRKTYQGVALGTADAAATTFEYDAVGNLAKTTDPRGKITTFGYDNRNRQITVTDALNHTTTTTYDVVGNKKTVTRPANPSFQFVEYDSLNRLKDQIDERGFHSYFDYDHAGNVVWQMDPNGNIYQYGYDTLNRKSSMTYPGNLATESWMYDEVGSIKTHTNRAGNVQTYATPDNRNRPTSFSWSDGTPGQSFGYDAKSRLTTTSNAEAAMSFTYDDADRKTSETETVYSFGLNRTTTVSWQYDHDGNLTRTIYPAGYQFVYEYTQRNQLANIKLDPALYGSTYNTPVAAYGYDASGNRAQRTLLNGGTTQYAVDDANLVNVITSYFANNRTGRFDYRYDQLNRRTYEQRDFGLADGFQYDPSDEVTGYQREGSLDVPSGTVSSATASTLAFDGAGNRTQVTGNWAPGSYVVNTLNQYTSDVGGSALYDAKGNLNSYAGWTVTYDAVNRLTGMDNNSLNRHIIYKYDVLNRRIAQSVNGTVTSYVFDNWDLIEERPTNGPQPRCYLFGAGTNELVVSFGSGYPNYFYFQDGRGNTSHLTDNSDVLVERYTYDLNGTASYFDGNNNPITSLPSDNRFLFAGAILLPESGLYDMRNRMYFPSWSRFLQTDPIGFKGDADNLYRYCGNDPVDKTDPMGLEAEIWLQRDNYSVRPGQNAEFVARRMPGWYSIVNNGKIIYKTRANEGPWGGSSMGVKAGDYYLRPKGGAWGEIGARDHTADTPAITGKTPGLKPGQPNASYTKNPALVHELGRSTACVTVCDEAVTKTKQVMLRDMKKGETTQMHIRDGRELSKPERTGGGGSEDGSAGGGTSSGPTAKDIDPGHQPTGIPSLGAEAVNRVRAYNL